MVITYSSFPTTSSTIFDIGNYSTKLLNIEPKSCINSSFPSPPKPLLISTPLQGGNFPVILFLHGYLLFNYFYSQLIQHISSHGFIVVAPQLYLVEGTDTTTDIKSTAEITNWLPDGLHRYLPSHVGPNLKKLALAGHSRGGKAAFALTLGKVTNTTPPVLTYIPQSFNLDMAVMVIGSGLGEVKRDPLFPACAPKGVNHRDFYNECVRPACYVVAKDYGHVDMLDDETKGVRGKATYGLCKNGKCREPMRRFVGGIVIAFLEDYLKGNSSDLMAIKDGYVTLPVELQDMDFRM
ncbi:hypothetical protein EJD97_023627 [Solanum chilense]|uniref:Uncharacterized protein n=1 Tax=Solanum chilense TaxID=4083 RepID=A0A6N2AVZ2_SOLCI|nr:hypothetical protein EJD97_023627 [Solanum chilense]